MIDHNLLEKILKDARKNPEFLEEVLEHTSMTNRVILQLYMTYRFLHTWKKQDSEMNFSQANKLWTSYPKMSTSLAAKFAELYRPEISIHSLYQQLEEYSKEKNIHP